MKHEVLKLFSLLTALALFVSACGVATPAQPTPDAAAIATSAVATVQAQYTQQAIQATPTSEGTSTPAFTATPTQQGTNTQPTVTTQPVASNGTQAIPCYKADFVQDVTIPDTMIIAPGTTFTKTWRVLNSGSCPWDSTYHLAFQSGEAMTTTTSIPMPQTVYPNQTVDLSVDMTAPDTEGPYTGYWRIVTPYGGTIGMGDYNAPLSVSITVSSNEGKSFAVTNVSYTMSRNPAKGCPASGTAFTFTATIQTDGEGDVDYYWERNPDDGTTVKGSVHFAGAGSKEVNWTWNLHPEAQKIDRWVALKTVAGSTIVWSKLTFNFNCP